MKKDVVGMDRPASEEEISQARLDDHLAKLEDLNERLRLLDVRVASLEEVVDNHRNDIMSLVNLTGRVAELEKWLNEYCDVGGLGERVARLEKAMDELWRETDEDGAFIPWEDLD